MIKTVELPNKQKKDNRLGYLFFWRHGPESNWRITVLQTIAFPLSNRAKTINFFIIYKSQGFGNHNLIFENNSCKSARGAVIIEYGTNH